MEPLSGWFKRLREGKGKGGHRRWYQIRGRILSSYKKQVEFVDQCAMGLFDPEPFLFSCAQCTVQGRDSLLPIRSLNWCCDVQNGKSATKIFDMNDFLRSNMPSKNPYCVDGNGYVIACLAKGGVRYLPQSEAVA